MSLLVVVLLLAISQGEATGGAAQQPGALIDDELLRVDEVLARVETALRSGDGGTARREVELAVELLRPLPIGEGHDRVAESWNRCGIAARSANALPQQIEAYERVLRHRESTLPEDHLELLKARGNVADALYLSNDYAGARPLCESVLAGFERTLPKDHRFVVLAREKLANVLAAEGDLRGARVLLESVLVAREGTLGEDHMDLAGVRMQLSSVLSDLGELDAARGLLEAVVEVCERTLPEDDRNLLAARGNLANLMRGTGDLVGARPLYERNLLTAERTLPGDHPLVLSARGNLAITLGELGDLPAARAMFDVLLEVYESIFPADHPNLVVARNNLALVLADLGDLAAARELQEDVLEIRERTLSEDHPHILSARTNLAATLAGMGDHASARALNEAVLSAAERTRPRDHPEVLHARVTLASSLLGMGELRGARELYESCAAGYERTFPADHYVTLSARAGLADVMFRMGELSAARALQEDVLEVYERTLPADHPTRITALGNLLLMFRVPDELPAVRARATELLRSLQLRLASFTTLSPREARESARKVTYWHPLLESLIGSEGSEEARTMLFTWIETVRHTSNASVRASRDLDPGLRSLREEAGALRARQGDLIAGGPSGESSPEDYGNEVALLARERDVLERELRSELAARGSFVGAIELDDVTRGLREGAVAVGYTRVAGSQPTMIARVVRSDGELTRVDLGSATELERLASSWRAALGKPLRGRGMGMGANEELDLDSDQLGGELRARVLDPVLAVAGDATILHVCLDAFLHVVPLEALPLEGEWTGDRVRVIREVSFARLIEMRDRSEVVPGLLAMGDVAFDAEIEHGTATRTVSAPLGDGTRSAAFGALAPLPATRDEAESTAAIFEASFGREPLLFTDEAATKIAFHEGAPGKRFLHLATHGWFAPESVASTLDSVTRGRGLWSRGDTRETVHGLAPMTLCGLALAGANRGRDALGRVPGIMTAEELAGIDLTACDLAVLSACETNVGIRRAGQGVQSLQAALHAAGVRTTITSLWKVDDERTQRLMQLFYTYMWVEELPKAEALWKAKSALREEGAALWDWSGWVLSGDPN